MKKYIVVICSAALLAGSAPAGEYVYSWSGLNVPITDNDLNGHQFSQTLSDVQGTISHISVTLNVSGGINGDLYGTLLYNNAMAVLLNRPGRSSSSTVGYSDRGFGADASGANQFTLDDGANYDVHFYRSMGFAVNGNGQLTGTWQPDGRNVDPLSAGSLFTSAPRGNNLAVFNNMDPNGVWTLFLADVSPGFEGSITGWGLNITTVIPEPGCAALAALAFSVACLARRRRSD